jgi:hypothetical protein
MLGLVTMSAMVASGICMFRSFEMQCLCIAAPWLPGIAADGAHWAVRVSGL